MVPLLLPSPVQKKRSILCHPPSCRGERGGSGEGLGVRGLWLKLSGVVILYLWVLVWENWVIEVDFIRSYFFCQTMG